MNPETRTGSIKLFSDRFLRTALLFLALALAALATLVHGQEQALVPVTKGADPPVEGFLIKSATHIECRGNTTEDEVYLWRYGDGEIDLSDPSMVSGGAAEILYEQHLRTVDGFLSFIKDFMATSDEQPNLKVSKIFGFTPSGTSPAVMLTHEEKVGMSNVNYGGILSPAETPSGFLTLCPWAGAGASSGQEILNAYNLGVAAGSSMKVTRVNATTETQVNTLYLPGLSYQIEAEGRGDIAAGFVVDVFEGTSPVFGPQPQAPPVQSRVQYEEHTSASGLWSFFKEMSFISTLKTTGSANPFPFQQVP
jgi:hypothetical protein